MWGIYYNVLGLRNIYGKFIILQPLINKRYSQAIVTLMTVHVIIVN